MKKGGRRALQILAVLGLASTIFLLWRLRMSNVQETLQTTLTPVRVQNPRRENLAETITAFGVIRSANQVSVLPRVGGMVTALEAEVGDEVEKGMLLALIDPELYRLDLQRAQAAYSSAASTWDRVNRLYSSGGATRQQWEDARSAHSAAEAQAAQARLRYEWTRVSSPNDGAVLVRHVAVGSLVAPEAGTPLYTIGSLDDLEVELQIPEQYYPVFADGIPRVDAGSDVYPGRSIPISIRTVAPWIDPKTRRFTVRCAVGESSVRNRVLGGAAPAAGADILNADSGASGKTADSADTGEPLLLRPGMLVEVVFTLRMNPRLLSLPVEALSGENGLWTVDSEGRARMMSFDSPFTVGGRVAIPDEWDGMRFVVEGQHFLQQGEKVRVLDNDDE